MKSRIQELQKHFSRETYNVFVLGLAFSCIFMAFNTTQALSVSALKTAFPPTNTTQIIFVKNIGYYTLLIVYIFFTISNIIAPSIVKLFGAKICLIVSAITYVLFVALYTYPLAYTLYAGACLSGIGAAVLWTSQGKVLLDNSNVETVERNSGIFIAFFLFNFIPGNLFVFLYLGDSEEISSFDRFIIFPVLTFLASLGLFLLFFILPIDNETIIKTEEKIRCQTRVKNMLNDLFIGIWNLLQITIQKKTLLLIPLFCVSGLSINLYAGGVYATCFGTIKAPLYRVGFAAMSLLLSGVGGFIGSSMFAINGLLRMKFTRKIMLLIAVIVDSLAVLLIYYNMPSYCNYPQPPTEMQLISGEVIKSSKLYIALTCSVLLGFADSLIKSIIYSIIGVAYEKSMSTPAVSMYKLFEALSLTLSFCYNPLINLYWQLLIYEIVLLTSFVLYIFVEIRVSIMRFKELQKKRELQELKLQNLSSINSSLPK